eukprot:1748505-Pyramimonas_sp.AAC.1
MIGIAVPVEDTACYQQQVTSLPNDITHDIQDTDAFLPVLADGQGCVRRPNPRQPASTGSQGPD